ncbi:GNAT family N-acetyltransferase [Miniphocaeibacter massiliensis]|uniref:GNAT family N-acetyltransferase n=1 Tax=Miniphocaeibacter massiliensis TaxID=2041841 RepID=UPI000C1BC908|nr:GNAT family N-acetyltransferase [Miniphocaeibacter massiliensis]
MKIIPINVEDYDGVYDLWINTPGMGLNNIDDSREGISKFIKRNPNTCFVAVENDNIIGVIICGHDGRRGYIYHTAVIPVKRKQGIGRALLEASMKGLEKEGISKVALVIFSKNDLGNKFWEKCGFNSRNDLTYRNKSIVDLVRIDT